jgi:hypothetical protein
MPIKANPKIYLAYHDLEGNRLVVDLNGVEQPPAETTEKMIAFLRNLPPITVEVKKYCQPAKRTYLVDGVHYDASGNLTSVDFRLVDLFELPYEEEE